MSTYIQRLIKGFKPNSVVPTILFSVETNRQYRAVIAVESWWVIIFSLLSGVSRLATWTEIYTEIILNNIIHLTGSFASIAIYIDIQSGSSDWGNEVLLQQKDSGQIV